MSDEDIIGYLLDQLDPEERAEVEAYVAAHPPAAARLDRLRLALAPLEADREPDPAPAGLALRTVGRLAAYLVEHEPRPPAPRAAEPTADTAPDLEPLRVAAPAPPSDPEVRLVGGRFWAELVVAASIGLVALGLVTSGISRARHQQQLVACQNNLRALHHGLTGYSDAHDGRFPQVGVEGRPTAGTFVAALVEAGQLPTGFAPTCPAAPAEAAVGYAYTLGYRAPTGELVGLRRSGEPVADNDLLPISADYPSADVGPGTGPASPHQHLMNVLFVGGNVRPTRTALVGPDRDDIYRNRYGQVCAGIDRTDVVLGRSGDRP